MRLVNYTFSLLCVNDAKGRCSIKPTQVIAEFEVVPAAEAALRGVHHHVVVS